MFGLVKAKPICLYTDLLLPMPIPIHIALVAQSITDLRIDKDKTSI
jgi:hypothetical protein